MKTKFNQINAKWAIVSAMALGSAGLSAISYAATATGTMTVSTTVAMSCTISAGAMTFASYYPTADAAVDGTATIQSSCTKGGAAIITMGQGSNANAGSTPAAPDRQMSNGDARLAYDIYSDADRSAAIGDTAETGLAVTGAGGAFGTAVYGRIPAGQAVGVGSFSDQVLIVVTF